MKNIHFSVLFLIFLISFVNTRVYQVASFTGFNGLDPKGSLLADSNYTNFYSFTYYGGQGRGNIFKTEIDDLVNIENLFNFTFITGEAPSHSRLLPINDQLIGTTEYGPRQYNLTGGNGVIFSINKDGSNYTNLHVFKGQPSDGSVPHSGVTSFKSRLWGTSSKGGLWNVGTIYSSEYDGSDYQVHYNFSKYLNHGYDIHCALTPNVNNTLLYGTTRYGGKDNYGVIFSFDPFKYIYKEILSFNTTTGGNCQHGNVLVVDDYLYGLTFQGGAAGVGTIYKVHESGNDFQVLHSFCEGSKMYYEDDGADDNNSDDDDDGKHPGSYCLDDGCLPYDSLTLLNNGHLAGTTRRGGSHNDGSLFKIHTSGKDYTVFHNFNKKKTGSKPIGSVTQLPTKYEKDKDAVYVLTQQGGDYGFGTLVSISYQE